VAEAHHHPKPSESVILAHGPIRGGQKKRLLFVLVVTLVVMAAEIAGGLLTRSLALLSDALHMLTHLGSVGLSYIAIVIASRPAAPEKTYRNWRYEVIAALFNGIAFIPLVAFIGWEAWERFRNPVEIRVLEMAGIAVAGLAANLVCASALHRHSKHDVNVRGAFLHMIADSLSSIGVLAAAGVLAFFKWPAIDPIVAALIGVLVLAWSLGLIRDSVRILLESAPAHLDLDEVRAAIQEEPAVAGVHDLHVWTITSKMYALTAHVILRDDRPVSECQELCRRISGALDARFDINHVTLQLETSGGESACCEHGTRRIGQIAAND
jgi:cobalt-zinc-cadmium efflux system protein